ncbi:hypothetical protein [Jiangella alkaliphila]|uniref:PBP domain-containing protein n=1 Tax=Jiangella alkaliphila TaxID=419479 RepID=A0A1H2KWE5_9ACTN|nr:hypothetical protein [Jiangella alkaliphila]SDU72999.1 hypothetical protein SAMN04488563_4450 [Jiangella alkaliphila]
MTRILWTRLAAGLMLFGLAVTLLVLGPPREVAQAAEDEPTESAVTVSGGEGPYDDFSDLRVTVSQTRNLTTQGITISWTGGAPTAPAKTFESNFVQIMQCWGEPDDPNLRETCQFGGGVEQPLNVNQGLGAETGRRSVQVDDPIETYEGIPAGGVARLPFRSARGGLYYPTEDSSGGQEELPDGFDGRLSELFTINTTNEIPWAVTAGDGTGRVTMWLQTDKESPHLGCGRVTEAAPDGQRCTLVVVPRGTHNVDGTDPSSAINSSPLSASNWAARIVVPLEFEPLGGYCPLGAVQTPTVGTELVAEAMTSWQPALCDDEVTYGYSSTGDLEAVNQLLSGFDGAPGLAFTMDPVVGAEGDPAIVHAPMAISGLTIALQIDVNPKLFASPEVEALWGTQVDELKLTPRLVAKLLTQSYQADVPGGGGGGLEHLSSGDGVENPIYITYDPEFVELNPIFANFPTSASGPKGLMVTLGNAASNREVWRWILADEEARDWLGGEPDEHGMIVNPTYEVLGLDETAPLNFPKSDPACDRPPNAPEDQLYCSLDLRPYMGSNSEVAQRVLRAHVPDRTVWQDQNPPFGYIAAPPRTVGKRWTIGLTDTASSARYGLYVASLRNQAGEFVAPTQESLIAGVEAMVDSDVPGVLEIDPEAADPDAYPLTMVTYGAVRVDQEPEALTNYARLLEYAAGEGQQPGSQRGQLPKGYVPLPADLREQTQQAAAELEALASATSTPTPTPTPTATTPPPGPGPGGGPAPLPSGDGPPLVPNVPQGPGDDFFPPPPDDSGPSASPSPGAPVPAPSPTPSPTPTETSTPVARSSSTPGTDAGIAPYVLMVALLIGAAAAVAGPALTKLGARFTGAA